MLIAACASASAIASGTWMNVRSFPPDKFRTSYEDEIKQRTTWFYVPKSLSEYKVAFLDIAAKLNVLSLMTTPPNLNGGYADRVFSAPQPSLSGFNEQSAFRHYLDTLHRQVLSARKSSYEATLTAHEELLDEAERLLRQLSNAKIRGQHRDFSEIVDANRAALITLDKARGPVLKRKWKSL